MHGRNPQNSLGAYEAGGPRIRHHDYLYSEAELAEWAERIDRVSRFAQNTFVIFNNDAAGKSFVNSLQLQEMLGSRRIPAPLELRRKYPVQLENMGPL